MEEKQELAEWADVLSPLSPFQFSCIALKEDRYAATFEVFMSDMKKLWHLAVLQGRTDGWRWS